MKKKIAAIIMSIIMILGLASVVTFATDSSVITGTSTDIPSLVYDLTEDMSGVRNLEFVEIYQHNNEWKMKALGERGDDSIEVELKKFGVPC